MTSTENRIEQDLITRLDDLKYSYQPDIRDRTTLKASFHSKFQTLDRVRLTDSGSQRLPAYEEGR